MRIRTPPSRLPLLVATLSVLSLAPVWTTSAGAQEFETELHQTRERLERARQAHLDLIAPRAFERAAEKVDEAEARYARGDRVESVRRSLVDARDALAEAERHRQSGTRILEPALRARSDALEADAPRLAPDAWAGAERELREAGRRLERGGAEGAGSRGREAEILYREAELRAIRSEVLGRATELREEARRADAHRQAPVTFQEAEERLRRANDVLEGDRSRLSEARALGEEAASGYRRAARLAAVADSVRRNRLSTEEVIRRQEAEAARVAEPLRFEPDLAVGIAPLVEETLAAIRGLQEDRRNLQEELRRTEEELAQAHGRSDALRDSLEAQLAGLEERQAETAARLRERERREQRLREVKAIFTEEEGEVLVSGDRLILRLHGFSFETGKAEVRPEHHSLLTKVQRVLREFGDAPVTVEGHTDAQGNPDFNRALSQRRAIAVREYLLAAMPISAERISAVGYGAERPIASNATEAGRERNRRIELVLRIETGA